STAQITNRAAMERTDGNLINCLHSLSTGEGQIVCSALRIATFENPYSCRFHVQAMSSLRRLST
ncbi:MAG: hypothetical protein AAF722_20255, partial [Cyanobacteria bacterium P01_C01_bin.70]